MKMFDISRLGQGPRPDLLQQQLAERLAAEKRNAEEEKAAKQDPAEAKRQADSKPDAKDAFALMLAMVQLLLPWAAAAIGIFFLVVFLVSKI